MLTDTRKKTHAANSRWKICPTRPDAIQAGPYAAVALLNLQRKRRANPKNDDKSLFFKARHQLPGRMYDVNVGNTQVSNLSALCRGAECESQADRFGFGILGSSGTRGAKPTGQSDTGSESSVVDERLVLIASDRREGIQCVSACRRVFDERGRIRGSGVDAGLVQDRSGS